MKNNFTLNALAAAVLLMGSLAGTVRAAENQPELARPEQLQRKMNSLSTRALRNNPSARLPLLRALYQDKSQPLADDEAWQVLKISIPCAYQCGAAEGRRELAAFRALKDPGLKAKVLPELFRLVAPLDIAEAEKLLADMRGVLPVSQLPQFYFLLAENALRLEPDAQKFLALCGQMRELKAEGDAKAVRDFEAVQRAQFVDFVKAYAAIDLDAAKRLVAPVQDLTAQQQVDLRLSYMAAAIRDHNRATYEQEFAALLAQPESPMKINALLNVAAQLHKEFGIAGQGNANCLNIISGLLQKGGLDDAQRFAVLGTQRGFYRVSEWSRWQNDPEKYAQNRRIAMAMLDMIRDGKVGDDQKFYADLMRQGVDFGDSELLARVVPKMDPEKNHLLFLKYYLRKKDAAAGAALLEKMVASPALKADDKPLLRGVIFFLKQRPLGEFDAEFADRKFDNVAKMLFLREISAVLYDGRLYETCAAIDDYVKKEFFVPIVRKEYTVRFLPHAPTTADGWSRTPGYDDWDAMETRFDAAGNYVNFDNQHDIDRHLKTSVQPALDPAYRVGVRIAWDVAGVHFYIRADDPGIGEVLLGRRHAGNIECLFRPGDDAPYYNSWFMNELPNVNDPYEVNWGTASKTYRLTQDHYKKDATLTEKGIAAHTFIPWLAYHDRLPVNGRAWNFGMQVGGRPTPSVTLSGHSHELGRTLLLKFEFTPEQLAALKRNVALMAFNKYDKIRQDRGGLIQEWADATIGDPEFYAAELETMVAELDAAGQKLIAPAPDAEIDGLYEKYVPLWAEIEHIVAEKRAAYLNRCLFAKGS